MSNARYGAIEAGGTKFICEVTDADGAPLAATRIATTTPQETLTRVLQFFTAQQQALGNIKAIGVAAFGPLDLQRGSPTFGRLLKTPKPGWSNADLVSPLRQAFGCPVDIDTDVNAAALAEALQGAGRGCSSVLYITVGTGIGGGVCIEGRTLKGALHPEMGHIRVIRHAADAQFTGCCPFHGDCLEGLASGKAIAARLDKSLDQLDDDNMPIVVGHYLGQLAANCVLLLSPQRIIFGGGVMQQQTLYPVIRATVARLLNGYAGIGTGDGALERLIVQPGLGERAGIRGAFLLATQGENP